ncbi:hypothetical protein PsYK624_146230 [Phanerochaete sordida]|uniref:Uncharacterized protein n=1 Tax=Phanerochaete sordida TaxID=48140 RepID=A0A9P3LL74_9APHY|nr:hypothetical protein PsYK624_146230 [Phanerochaete sordida]
MAEYHQVLACCLTARRWLDTHSADGAALVLHNLWADPAASGPTAGAPYDATSGHVRVVPYPQMAETSVQELLHLVKIYYTTRTVVFHLQSLYLQVELQHHIMCQAFSKDQWDLEVRKTSKETRGFSVCIALDFGDAGVVSFVAPPDKISVKVHLESSFQALPSQPPDVYLEYPRFLQGVADWLRELAGTKDTEYTKLAVTAIQEADNVFGGMGPYTTNEVFFLAGLSPFLTVHEVFGCASRTARLCEAFWTLAHEAHTTLPDFLAPLYRGTVLAATREQRAAFDAHLHIHGKASARLSPRMKALLDHYTHTAERRSADTTRPFLRHGIGGLWDVFEPTLLRPALEKPAHAGPRLPHLVFGPIEWAVNGGARPRPRDPLSAAFAALGVQPDAPTNLELSRYRAAPFLPPAALHAESAPVRVYAGAACAHALWTLTPQVPLDARAAFRSGRRDQELHPVAHAHRLTLRHVAAHTREYAAGPLEHPAVAALAGDRERDAVPAELDLRTVAAQSAGGAPKGRRSGAFRFAVVPWSKIPAT